MIIVGLLNFNLYFAIIKIMKYSIHEISKYTRGYKNEDQRQEDLLTGIFIWSIEREKNLLIEIIKKAFFLNNSNSENIVSKINDADLDFELQFQLRGDEREIGRIDAKISSDNLVFLIENKVLSNSIKIDQVELYHRLAEKEQKNKEYFLLLTTPDNKKYIEKEIFQKLNGNYRSKTLWISWLEIYHICEELLKENEVIIHELMEGIKMQGLKPFSGFSTDLKTLKTTYKTLKKVQEFFDMLGYELEKNNINKSQNKIFTGLIDGWVRSTFYGDKLNKDETFYLVGLDLETEEMIITFGWENKNNNISNQLKKNTDFKELLRKKLKDIDDSLEIEDFNDSSTEYVGTSIKYKNPIILDKKIVQIVSEIILTLREEIVNKLKFD